MTLNALFPAKPPQFGRSALQSRAMAEDQRRSAERVPLDIPIEGKIGEIFVRLVEISLIGCLLEHSDRMSMGSTFTVQFRWAGENVSLKGRVVRTQMRPVDGRPGYLSGVQFAERVEDSPEPLQRVLRSLLPDFMPEIEAAAPSLFAEHPFFRHADDEDEAEVAPVVAPVKAADNAAHSSSVKVTPPALDDKGSTENKTNVEDEIELELFDEVEDDLDLDAELPTPFIECTLTDGVWTRRAVSEPIQPREGFTIVQPEHDREIDELCFTYRVADPDTRRLIRVSFDLLNAKHGVPAGSDAGPHGRH